MPELDWKNLGFKFRPVRSNIRFHYADGKWSDAVLSGSFDISISIAANVLHYGQAIFEGGKVFSCKDGKVRMFRPDENAVRLNNSARRLMMPEFPVEKYIDAVKTLVRDNLDYVPPYGTGGALYLRPFMFGTTPQVGVSPSLEYELIIMAIPVGAYYTGGIKPVDAMISRDYDRAAPLGTGHIKSAGNYAASLVPAEQGHSRGCAMTLFLDPATHTYVDEFNASNFVGITKDGEYVTPDSASVLPSITNKSLMTYAADLGIKVSRRPIAAAELGGLAEAAGCGTAVVITPVRRIFDGERVLADYGCTEIGPLMKMLYDEMTGVQRGERPDKHGFTVEI